jgi:hypothetical protein
MVRTLVNPWDRRSSTMVRRFAARRSAFAVTATTACLSGLGALADQPRFQFGNRGHLREQEASHSSRWDMRQVAEHEVNMARHK